MNIKIPFEQVKLTKNVQEVTCKLYSENYARDLDSYSIRLTLFTAAYVQTYGLRELGHLAKGYYYARHKSEPADNGMPRRPNLLGLVRNGVRLQTLPVFSFWHSRWPWPTSYFFFKGPLYLEVEEDSNLIALEAMANLYKATFALRECAATGLFTLIFSDKAQECFTEMFGFEKGANRIQVKDIWELPDMKLVLGQEYGIGDRVSYKMEWMRGVYNEISNPAGNKLHVYTYWADCRYS